MGTNINLEIKLPKVPEIELVAIGDLEKIEGYCGISNGKLGEARILVTEAIINGLGHSGTDRVHVKVGFRMTKENLLILVTD